jgi:uncharacterized protein YjiS (DUF1127 family)
MSALTFHRSLQDPLTARSRPRPTLGQLALRTIETIETWAARAHQRRALRELPEHVLRDLALTEADVAAESSKPFWRA